MTTIVPFWANDPLILLNKEYIFQAWPSSEMTFDEKLNSITRFVLLLSFLGFLVTKSTNILGVGVVTLFFIFVLYKMRKQQIVKGMKEGFNTDDINNLANTSNDKIRNIQNTNSEQIIINPATLEKFLKSEFEPTNKKNPLGNVLLTEIHDKPHRKAAPPSFQTEVYEDINKSTKKMVQQLNPEISNTNKQLYGDLGEKFEFDQSMWHYYSNPNTKIPNDQGAFAHWLYGDMPSARDGDAQALLQDNIRYNLY